MSPDPFLPGRVGRVVVHVAATSGAGWLVGWAASGAADERGARWVLGRAGGITALLLLTALVVSGMLLADPHRGGWRRSSQVAVVQLHAGLAAFTGTLVALHVVVVATDDRAHVGWWGAVLPLASGHRPVAVTFGVLAAWAGLASALTTAATRRAAGRSPGRGRARVHRLGVVAFALTWLHAVFAGSDVARLRPLYVAIAVLVLATAAFRYTARAPRIPSDGHPDGPADVRPGAGITRGRRGAGAVRGAR